MLLILALWSAIAAANPDDSFIIVRDGKEYSCQPKGPRTSPGDPAGIIRCASLAQRTGPWAKDEIIQLCEGAWSEAPATCAQRAYRALMPKNEIVELCQQAASDGPAACAESILRAGGFSSNEALRICRRSGTLNNAACAIRALREFFSREDAIRLCRAVKGGETTRTVPLALPEGARSDQAQRR